MSLNASFEERVSARSGQLSTAEREVTRFFQQNREEVLIASAASLASKIGTSNATVVRTALALGYASLADMRRQLADEIRADLSPASRLERTLGSVGDALEAAFHSTLAIHVEALENLRRNVSPALFASAVNEIRGARRAVIFGIGPSAAMANYFAMQLGRFGIEADTITQPDSRSRMISTAFAAATWSLSWLTLASTWSSTRFCTASPMFVQSRSLSPIHWLRHSGTAWT
jgi:DNA-binding MurR/RpiR family transcriptional regulator